VDSCAVASALVLDAATFLATPGRWISPLAVSSYSRVNSSFLSFCGLRYSWAALKGNLEHHSTLMYWLTTSIMRERYAPKVSPVQMTLFFLEGCGTNSLSEDYGFRTLCEVNENPQVPNAPGGNVADLPRNLPAILITEEPDD